MIQIPTALSSHLDRCTDPNGPTVLHTPPCYKGKGPVGIPPADHLSRLSFAWLEFHSLRMQNIRQDAWWSCISGPPASRVDQSVQCPLYTVRTAVCSSGVAVGPQVLDLNMEVCVNEQF